MDAEPIGLFVLLLGTVDYDLLGLVSLQLRYQAIIEAQGCLLEECIFRLTDRSQMRHHDLGGLPGI